MLRRSVVYILQLFLFLHNDDLAPGSDVPAYREELFNFRLLFFPFSFFALQSLQSEVRS